MSQTGAPSSQRMLAGRYSVDELLGQGGMSTVYRGTDVKLGRQVAIKIMRANLADDEAFRVRFRQEAQSASRLAHPSIVRVLDAGDDLIQSATGPQRLPFIVMEYVDGQDLREMLNEDKLSAQEACRVVDAVLTALDYSHRAGIVHRDIKPANIMITKSGQVKVMDFGIARAISETSSTLQQTTAILGTASYFSPEQAKGEVVDVRTDLYSTGVLLYELLAGQLPFKGDTAVAVAYQHVSERPVPPSTHNPEISPELDRVVMHALTKDRNRRFQTAGEFRDAMKLAAAGVMPDLDDAESETSVLFSSSDDVSESDLALRRLSVASGSARSQSRPPVMWVWVAILMIAAIIGAVGFWVTSLQPRDFSSAANITVPVLEGEGQEAALASLASLGLVATVEEISDDEILPGHVVRTEPGADERVAEGTEITVYVSNGSDNPKVPAFETLSLDAYKEQLEQYGLQVGNVIEEDHPRYPANRVLQTSPAPGERGVRGGTVDVTIATGMVWIPDVRRQPLAVARATIGAVAQDVASPQNCPVQDGFPVNDQSLEGQQPQGSRVELYYCGGANG